MTREEATICKIYLDDLDRTHDCNEYKLLMQLLDRDPCEDCVSRQAIDQNIYDYAESNGLSYANMKNYILATPSVSPTCKKGKWIRKPVRNDKGGCVGAEMICTCCGKDNECDKNLNYCPNCGIEMEMEE